MFKERGSAKFNTFGKAFAVLMLFIFLISFVTGAGIGIGATDPRVGNIYFGQTPSGPSDMTFDGGNDSLFFFRNSGAENGMTSFSSNSGALMTIRNNGNVGIGTTSPSRKLHIIDTTEQALFEGSNQGAIKLKKTDSAYGYSIYSGANGELGFYDGANVNMYIQGGNIKIPSLISCNPITSNANGTLTCEEGAGGGGTSQWTTSGSNIYYNTGNVGIGTPTPAYKLDVGSNARVQGDLITGGTLNVGTGYIKMLGKAALHRDDSNYLHINPGGDFAGIVFNGNSNKPIKINYGGDIIASDAYFFKETGDDSGLVHGGDGNVRLRTDGADRLIVNNLGNVGIGTSYPREKLEVNGLPIRTDGAQYWSVLSDARLKKNVKEIKDPLQKLVQLRGVNYEWIEPEKHGDKVGSQMGFVAQEVEKVFPQWVSTGSDGYKILTPQGIDALLVEAIQEQQQEIKELKDIVCKDKKNLNYCS